MVTQIYYTTDLLKESLTFGLPVEKKIMSNLHLLVKCFPSKHQNKYQYLLKDNLAFLTFFLQIFNV
jgi:hypothetical protein